MTKVGFRRDVRLFLGVLVGFLVTLILLLLLLLQSFLWHAREVVEGQWSAVSRMVMDDVHATNLLSDTGSLEPRLEMLRARYDIAGITVKRAGASDVTFGIPATTDGTHNVTRTAGDTTIIFTFDASRLRNMGRTFWGTAVISLIATCAGALLLIAYLPRITGPIEEMLDAAAHIETKDPNDDEQQYIIDTFRRSIATLKSQEAELQRMHDMQKSRADDLERVTAALTRSLTSGFLSVDATGCIVEMNAAAAEILGIAGERVGGATIEEVLPASDFRDALREATDRRVGLTRVEIKLSEPSSRDVGLTTVPLLSEQREFLGMLALFTDLTHIRRLETRLRDIQTLADLGEISAGIAHEFRNSLGAMLGFIRLARKEPITEKTERCLQNAESEGAELAAAVDSLLAFARPMSLQMSETDLGEVVSAITARFHSPSIDVSVESASVNADVALISRAIENLIRNGLDSVAEKGEGRVRVIVGGGASPFVRVEDDGVGIDPDDVPRLLLPFQSQKPNGYGLGLPLARKIALLHDARFDLTGTPGKGAAATMTFSAAGRQN